MARETDEALVVKALLHHDNLKTSMDYIHDVEDMLQDRYSPLRLLVLMVGLKLSSCSCLMV